MCQAAEPLSIARFKESALLNQFICLPWLIALPRCWLRQFQTTLSVVQAQPQSSLAHLAQLRGLSMKCRSLFGGHVRRFLLNSATQLALLTHLQVGCGL